MHPAGVLFLARVRDVSAGDGVHTYSCVRYATLPSVCTDYARSVSQADETGFYAPSVAHNALPRRPRRLRPLRCGKICGVTCAHRWPVLTSYYVVKRCEMMCCTTYRYLYFLWEGEVCGCVSHTTHINRTISAYNLIIRGSRWGRAGDVYTFVRANSEAV